MYLSKTLSAFYRGFSLFLLIFSFSEGVFLEDWRGIALGTYVALGSILNYVLKHIFANLFSYNQIRRPLEYKNCGPFDSKNSDIGGLGMPSGHSQNFAMVATMLAVTVLDKRSGDPKTVLKIGLLVILTVGAMYSRVHRGCHTISQTVVGSIIGVVIGYFLTKYFRNPFSSSKKYKGLLKNRSVKTKKINS